MIIETQALTQSYRRTTVLRNVAFEVPEGSLYALIGPNGAGKTTLLKTALGILPARSGTATVLGVDSRRLSPREFHRIGYVADHQELPKRLRISEFLDYLRPLYPDWERDHEARLVRDFGLDVRQRIADLSHGTRSKVALTAALAFRPRLLVMDEPFGGLDPLVRDELLATLLGEAADMTVVLSSHELDEIEASATHVGYLEDGELRLQEPLAALTARTRRVRVTFGVHVAHPTAAPRTWIDLATDGNVLTFLDTAHVEAELREALAQLPDVQAIDIAPAPLRTVFTAHARLGRARREAA